MDLFWKAVAGLLIVLVLGMVLEKQGKDMAVMLSMAVCAMGAMIALHYLEPVLDMLRELEALGDMDGELLAILLKAMGIGLVAEIAAMICADAGNAALGKTMQLAGSAAVLWLSLPLLKAFVSLIRQMLGGI